MVMEGVVCCVDQLNAELGMLLLAVSVLEVPAQRMLSPEMLTEGVDLLLTPCDAVAVQP